MAKFWKLDINHSRGDLTISNMERVNGSTMENVVSEHWEQAKRLAYEADFNDGEVDAFIEEFMCRFYTGYGMGEEDSVIFIDEESKWFPLLDSIDSWSDDMYYEFTNFVYDETATYE
jgi:hypothetical protein